MAAAINAGMQLHNVSSVCFVLSQGSGVVTGFSGSCIALSLIPMLCVMLCF